MAVVVQCFHCNTILELDEGFRGGVCRCSTCGSLLQVPKASGAGAPKARPAAPGGGSGRPAAPGDGGDTGLSRGQFEPSGAGGGSGASGKRPAIPDFGGSSSGLRGGRPRAPTATEKPTQRVELSEPMAGSVRAAPHLKQVKKNNALLYVGIMLLGLVLVVALVVAGIWVMRSTEERHVEQVAIPQTGGVRPPVAPARGNARETAIEEQTPVAPAVPAHATVGFLDIPLVGRKIVLSIDGASSMSDNFSYVQAGVYQAVERLAPGQELRVALWRDQKVVSLPAKGFVGKAGLNQLKKEFEVVGVRGSSDAAEAMKASLKLGGDQVIFVTAKPAMDSQIAVAVLAENSGGKARLDSVKLDSEDMPSPMEELARKTGGTFHFISGTQLQELVR